MSDTTLHRRDDLPAVLLILGWTSFYSWRALLGHASLETNAYDLSLLDYALWNGLGGHAGYVPFLGYSLYSVHFTPVLWIIAPFYALFQSPACLILLQISATAIAAWLFYRFARGIELTRGLALGLVVVLLMSRRTHSAVTSFFYPECLQAALTFALVAAWRKPRWIYWSIAGVLLATKEDAALYLAGFGAVQFMTHHMDRRRAVATMAISVVWAALAFGVFIPASRAHDGLPRANPLLETRFASDNGTIDATTLASRPFSRANLTTLFNLAATTGFLPLLGWPSLAPALPGVLANSLARPGTQQAALIGHYFWPVLPWLFMACAAGTVALQRRSSRLAAVLIGLLVCGTFIDNPAMRRLPDHRIDPQASRALDQLGRISFQATDLVLAQANLIPHLPHSNAIRSLGGERTPSRAPDVVLLTPVGNLWPYDAGEIASTIRQYDANPEYQRIADGPLYAFRRRRSPP